MFASALRPLRTTCGDQIPLTGASLAAHSGLLDPSQSIVIVRDGIQQIVNASEYQNWLPANADIGPGLSPMGAGVAVMPVPGDLPCDPFGALLSLFVSGPSVADEDLSRRLWVEVVLNLGKEHEVGAICYGGYPFLPYYVTPRGYNSANFGLPREVNVSWNAQANPGFIDDELSVTHQEPVSHSGVHIIPVGPVVTNQLRIRFSDFPKVILRAQNSPFVMAERWGIVLPYLMVCGHRERGRYRPRVPGGLLAAIQTSYANNASASYFHRALSGTSLEQQTYAGGSADLVAGNPQIGYFPMTAASAFQTVDARRVYSINGVLLSEKFSSNGVASGGAVILAFEQSEEHSRCLAGLRVRFDNKLTNLVLPGTSLAVRIYEVDPPEGVSPLEAQFLGSTVTGKNKYAHCLYTNDALPMSDTTHVLKFVRPTGSRYLVAAFAPVQPDRPVIISGVELVQSVDISVNARPAHTRQVSSLHFRLIGPNLADDYASLGSKGFQMTVDHVVAGEQKRHLFHAASLLDLLHTGGCRIFSNHRRRAVEEESSVTLPGSYSYQHGYSRTNGWRRSETGGELRIPPNPAVGPNYPDPMPDGEHGFTVFGSQETRSHMKNLGAIPSDFMNIVANLALDFQVVANTHELWQVGPGNQGIWRAWGEYSSAQEIQQLQESLRVDGVWNANIPPFFASFYVTTHKLLEAIQKFASSSASEDLTSFLSNLSNQLNMLAANPTPAAIANFTANLNSRISALSGNMGPYAEFAEAYAQVWLGSNLIPAMLFNGFNVGCTIGTSGGANFGGSISGMGGVLLAELTAGGSGGISGGASAGNSLSASSSFPTMLHSTSIGTSGNISKQASQTNFSYAQHLHSGYDASMSRSDHGEGSTLNRRITRRAPPDGDRQRITGAEVMWQGELMDIVTGSIPLNLTLPALASKAYRTSDETVRVRLAGPLGSGIEVDVWFDIREEAVRDDY